MNALVSLWLPILLSAVVVFIISSLVHMVLKWHASDYGFFVNEDAIREAIPFLDADRELGPDIAAATELVRTGRLVAAAESAVGDLD